MYDTASSPLLESGALKRKEAYAPIVEATILANVFAYDDAVRVEMDRNFEHTYRSFGVRDDDYAKVVAQIAEMRDDKRRWEEVDWCAGTELHGLAKPVKCARRRTGQDPTPM